MNAQEDDGRSYHSQGAIHTGFDTRLGHKEFEFIWRWYASWLFLVKLVGRATFGPLQFGGSGGIKFKLKRTERRPAHLLYQ